MTEPPKVKISISKSNETIKQIEANYDEGSLSSLVSALKSIRTATNEFLTVLVEEQKSLNNNQKSKSRTKASVERCDSVGNDESDVELEEDFIDSQIKRELSTRHGSGSVTKHNAEKDTRSQNRKNKRMKHS